MKKSKFTEAQIVFPVKQSEQYVKVEEICRHRYLYGFHMLLSIYFGNNFTH